MVPQEYQIQQHYLTTSLRLINNNVRTILTRKTQKKTLILGRSMIGKMKSGIRMMMNYLMPKYTEDRHQKEVFLISLQVLFFTF